MINHTGQATYHLSQEADLSPQADQGREDSPASGGGGMTELADVVGQLSLNGKALCLRFKRGNSDNLFCW